MNIYLAGSFFPIEDYSDWREKLKTEAPEKKYLDPLDNDQFSIATFTEQDLEKLKEEADMTFIYFSKNKPRGNGTSGEMGASKVIGVQNMMVDEKSVLYPFLVGVSKYILTNLELGIECIKKINTIDEISQIVLNQHKKLITNNGVPETAEIKANGDLYAVTRIKEGQSSLILDKIFKNYFNKHISHILLDENKILNTDLCHMSKRIFTNEETLNFYLKELEKRDEFKAIYSVMKEFPD